MSVLNSFNREVEIAKFEIKDHFSFYKKWYVLLGILLLVGAIVGIVVGLSMKTNLTLAKVPEKLFVRFVQGELNVGSLFFMRIFSALGIAIVVWLCCLKSFLCPLGVALLVYRSFMLGVASVMLIALYNITGLINVLLVVVPCYFSLLFFLLTFLIVCINHCKLSKIYGGSVLSREFWCKNKKTLIIIGILSLVCVVLEIILLPILSSTLVIVKS